MIILDFTALHRGYFNLYAGENLDVKKAVFHVKHCF